MGELRNVETHEALYYPSAFHALAAVYCQLTGAAATTAYTVSSVTAAVWLFPVSAAVLQYLQTACAVFLIGFMLFIAFFDTGDWVRSARRNRQEPIVFAPKR